MNQVRKSAEGDSFLCVQFAPGDGTLIKTIRVMGTLLGLLMLAGTVAAFIVSGLIPGQQFMACMALASGMLGLCLYIISSRRY